MMVVSQSVVNEANQGSVSEVSFHTVDGYPLSGTRYSAIGTTLGNIVVAGATGVPQGFYRRFANYAVELGFNVLTFDYRGIGQSKRGSLRDLQMSFLDWGRFDAAAAVDAMHEKGVPLYRVGHSYGGQALGLLPNHHLLTAAYSFGSGAGWAGWMSKSEAIKVKLLWNMVLPALVKWKGYMAWSTLGMGEDLPLGVYQEWKRWCQNPRYFFDDENFKHLKSTYAEVAIPYVAATSTDDLWAPPKSRDAFCEHYVGCDLTLKTLEPLHNQPIGHIGYFRESNHYLWDEMLMWFDNVSKRHPAGKRSIH
ncbi:hydrolase [Oleiphilus messinensis]|uniref:Hydrolase n=1 Tax=Oleiphilus messinensis TaxID=141451 RepID=A0A1Y0I9S8_9GAMM|nr:alpha/beta fold hydrolase [Oleiphilus messinensis]ARU56516.1 hydrolase [Oleiphilus messinensis]